jgi:hypothetical protein
MEQVITVLLYGSLKKGQVRERKHQENFLRVGIEYGMPNHKHNADNSRAENRY